MNGKHWKKLLSIVVVCTMVLGLCPNISVYAEEVGTRNTSIYIGKTGKIDDIDEAPSYYRVNDGGELVTGTAENYNLYYNSATKTMTLNNFVLVNDKKCAAIATECDLNLILKGVNKVTSSKDCAIYINGNVTITGDGSLEAVSTCNEVTAEKGEKYIPSAMTVDGSSFSNSSTLILSSNNPEFDLTMWKASVRTVKNTGHVTGRFAAGEGDGYIAGTNMVPCDTEYGAPTDHAYIGKAYYFTTDEFYPNNLVGSMNEGDWRVVGKYDENGNPLPSKIWYQYIYVNKYGAVMTEDFHDPVQYLVYDDNPAAMLTDKDIAAVADGNTYTFNADLYAVWFSNGNVTVNGNVILDCSCFEGAITKVDDETRTQYERDEAGNIKFRTDSTGASITINGNTGFLSLNDSYKGDVTVNGDVNGSARYDDVNVSDGYEPTEYIYAAIPNAGKVMERGRILVDRKALEGYKGQAVYQDAFYTLTEKTVSGENVRGTTAAVNGDSLVVDVSADGITDQTYPLVRSADSTTTTELKALLTNQDSKLTAMDISLIEDNTKEIEPSKSVNLYINDLSGYNRPALFHVKDDGTIEKLFVASEDTFGGNIVCSTNSFSTYFIAEDQELKNSGCEHTHTEIRNVKAATCTETGYTGDTYCKDCGVKTKSGTVLPAKGHTWDAGVVTQEPTETAEGIKTYTCSMCGMTKTETIPKKEAVKPQPLKKGDVVKVGKAYYKVIDVKKKEVAYKAPSNKNVTTVSILDTVSIGGVTYKVTSIAGNAFANNTKLTKAAIGSNVKTIGKKAFYKCTKLKTVTIGKNVTTIGCNAFCGCNKLTTVRMGSKVTTVSDKAFYKCTSLTNITIPSKVKKIGKQAFYGDKKLKTITIKTTMLTSKNVGSSAFKGIYAKATIKVPKSKLTSYKKILKAKGVSSKANITK
ncbi:MAG: leucine-rich repeat domain-containing protein [Lachnospiraceae bacterium]|nr:leucine-rich repeat domain-containing protein [Lachnospiraceae bacterium]